MLYFLLSTLSLFFLSAVYAPFLASGDPIWVTYGGQHYFPLIGHLFLKEYFSKPIDLFFNITIFSLPLFLFCSLFPKSIRSFFMGILATLQLFFFIFVLNGGFPNPLNDHSSSPQGSIHWEQEVSHLTPNQKIELLWQEIRKDIVQEKQLQALSSTYHPSVLDTNDSLNSSRPAIYQRYLEDKKTWIDQEKNQLEIRLLPLWRLWYWEESTGNDKKINPYLPWDMRSRLGGKDLTAALIYGTRVCIVVGILSVALSLSIGIPVGAISAYLGGQWDIILMRLIEIWEAFPYFFMLLFIMSVMQTKSIFLIIAVIGLFGWSGFARFTRAEVLRQRALPYVEACQVMGLSHLHILFRQILPNSLTPIMTLLPFAFMAAIGAEASLAFLGLSEEGSCSWGTLMDEGRKSFPAESYLLWPPAILLTVLLVTIALLGDALRDANDPKLKP